MILKRPCQIAEQTWEIFNFNKNMYKTSDVEKIESKLAVLNVKIARFLFYLLISRNSKHQSYSGQCIQIIFEAQKIPERPPLF